MEFMREKDTTKLTSQIGVYMLPDNSVVLRSTYAAKLRFGLKGNI